VRDRNGTITPYDYPGAVETISGTEAINKQKNITGVYVDGAGVYHGYLSIARSGHAAQWNVTHSNVASLVSPPRVDPVELEILSATQSQAVLTALLASS